MADGRFKRYEAAEVAVGFDASRCIHAARCVRELPSVFDTARRPWISPDGAAPDRILEQVARCPTGALVAWDRSGERVERTPAEVVIEEVPDGPLYVRGDVRVTDPDGGVFCEERRVALCRCGASGNRPFCDGSHTEAGFTA